MTAPLIVDQSEFEDLCLQIRQEGLVAFDTEFISDDSYRPRLCLLQFALADHSVAVDPLRVEDLGSWWNLMADSKTTVVVHAGREEILFCLRCSDRKPQNLVDIQIAEGLCSRAYPLGYENLVARVLGHRLAGTETRTDWSRRPLSPQQIAYALDDVRYVLDVWQHQKQKLQQLNRLAWAEAEFVRRTDDLAAEHSESDWRRLSGIHRLNPRELAIARELYRWRESEAASHDQPSRRILRDDLIIEIARRQPLTVHNLMATRGMKRTNFRRRTDAILDCVTRGQAVPKEELPRRPAKPYEKDHEEVLGRFLGIALADRCAEQSLSTTLVGTSSDIREFIRWHLEPEKRSKTPRLMEGWRAEVCGDLLDDLLHGRISLRVVDVRSSRPFVFERRPASETEP